MDYKSKEWLLEAFKKYNTYKEIADICGVSKQTIKYWQKKFSIKLPETWLLGNQKYTFDEHYFDRIDTEHKAYWLGFIMADGCISKNSPSSPYNRFEINLKSIDINFLKLFKEDLKSTHPIKVISNTNKKLNFECEICSFRINSKNFVANLIEKGISPNKTGKECIPECVPYDLIRHFIRGFFDGDGSLTITKALRFCSSSKTILESINQYFENNLGITYKIREDNHYQVPFFLIDSTNTKYNKQVLDLIYKDATIYLERKHKRYLEMYCAPRQ